jgi:hypothetical protein
MKFSLGFARPCDVSTDIIVLQKPFKNEGYSHCHWATNPTTPTIGVVENPFGRNGFVN